MKEAGYPAARVASPIVHAHFARHRETTGIAPPDPVASIPDAATIEDLIDAAFWTSLRHEEGYLPRISLAYVSQQQAAPALIFDRSLPLIPEVLTKLAPAVERAGIHLCVWPDYNGLRVWGMTRNIPPLCLVLEVADAGLLVIKHHRGAERLKFVNVAVLEGDQIKIVDENASSLPDCPTLVSSLLEFQAPSSENSSTSVLVQLAVSMRAHGRGGLLLVVPAGSREWCESIVQPLFYSASPPFDQLHVDCVEEFSRAVEATAGLTAVDGATVLNSSYQLLGFGGKITRRRGYPQVEQVNITEPIRDNVAVTLASEQLGGTRHFAAAQFVHDQHDSIALVASKDGRFTVFAWSPCEDMVHAHRVDVLLL